LNNFTTQQCCQVSETTHATCTLHHYPFSYNRKNKVLYNDFQVKLREATQDKGWNAKPSLLYEICDATFNKYSPDFLLSLRSVEFEECMEHIKKRLTDEELPWRVILKVG